MKRTRPGCERVGNIKMKANSCRDRDKDRDRGRDRDRARDRAGTGTGTFASPKVA